MEEPKKKVWVIRYELDPCRGEISFVMTSPEGKIHEGLRPKLLARHAWNHDADAVIHDYDLRLDPDL